MNNLPGKIKRLREVSGLTQQDLANELLVSVSTVHRWEQDVSFPSRVYRKALDKLFQKYKIEEAKVEK